MLWVTVLEEKRRNIGNHLQDYTDDVAVLGCDAVCTRRWIPTFRRSILSPSSGLKMETVCFSEMLVFTYETTWCNSPEQQHRRHRREISHLTRLHCTTNQTITVDADTMLLQIFFVRPMNDFLSFVSFLPVHIPAECLLKSLCPCVRPSVRI
jgi:hypothetical protein